MRGARGSFLLARTASARLLAASLAFAIALSVAIATALTGFGARALPAAVHQRLAHAPGTSIAISGQVGARTASADTVVIHSLLGAALRRVPFSVLTGRWSDSLALPQPRHSGATPLLEAAAFDDITRHAALAVGRWPGPPELGRPVGVALPVSTARLLGLSVGQVLALHDSQTGAGVRLVVSGLFRMRNPAGPYWRLSLLGTAGKFVLGSFITYGPAVVSPAALDGGRLTVGQASWVVTVDTSRIPANGVAQLRRRLASVIDVLRGRQSLGGLQVSTGLPQTLAALASGLVVSRSLLLIDSLELVLLALAAVALAARLLASQREAEIALLSARGVARRQLALAAFWEAVLLAVPAGLVGAVVGVYGAGLLVSATGLSATVGSAGLGGVITEDSWLAAGITVLAIAVMTWPALRPATPGAARARRGRQAALSLAGRSGLDLALVGLGLAAVWELHRYSAVQQVSTGGLGIDPVLAIAPVVALAGIALIPLRLLPVAARLLDRTGSRARHVDAAMAGWQVSRRPQRHAGPILLVVLTVATGTLALTQHQSWRQSQLDQASFSAGADTRVQLAGPLALAHSRPPVTRRGVSAAMPVSDYYNGYEVLALDARTAPATVLLRPDLSALPRAALWRRITPGRFQAGLSLPGRPARLEITAMARPPAGQRLGALALSLFMQDGSGVGYQISAGDLPADARYHRLTVMLSAPRQAQYPLRVLGLTVGYQLAGFPATPLLDLPQGASTNRELRAATGRATVTLQGIAVSASAVGRFPAPFGAGRVLAGWHALAVAPELADPFAYGIAPSVTAWRSAGGAATLAFTVGAGELVQQPGTPPLPVSGRLSITPGGLTRPVPAIATAAFLGSAGAHVGQVVPLPVGGVSIPARLVAEVRGFPTLGSHQPALIVDLASLEEALALRSQPPLPVTQWWLPTGLSKSALPPGASVTTRAGLASDLLADPLPKVQQLGLLVVVLAAALLACVGLAVSVAAAVRERRLTDAVLAALGIGPGGRVSQLCLEQVILSVPAALAGALIGVALARLLVPAVTLTGAAATPFPPVQPVTPLVLLTLLALLVAGLSVVAAATTLGYRPDPAARLRSADSE